MNYNQNSPSVSWGDNLTHMIRLLIKSISIFKTGIPDFIRAHGAYETHMRQITSHSQPQKTDGIY
ncbi:MAG TPA: hypothetical protein PLI57_11355 [Spirochaetota bacterium]|nr:hypothetical protein [Spirochaetota bacterium]